MPVATRQPRAASHDENGAVVASAVTGGDGTYRFRDLLPGSYTLTASGYAPVASRVEVGGGASESTDIALGGVPGPDAGRNGTASADVHRRGAALNGLAASAARE